MPDLEHSPRGRLDAQRLILPDQVFQEGRVHSRLSVPFGDEVSICPREGSRPAICDSVAIRHRLPAAGMVEWRCFSRVFPACEY